MTDAKQDDLVFDGFMLGVRILLQAHDIQISTTDEHKLWELLRNVADGSATLVPRPIEKLIEKTLSKGVQEWHAQNVHLFVAKDRDLAASVMRAMDQA